MNAADKNERILIAARAALAAAVESLAGAAEPEPRVFLALGMACVHAGRLGDRLAPIEVIQMFASCLNMTTEAHMQTGRLPLGLAAVTPPVDAPDLPCTVCGIVNSRHDRDADGLHWRTDDGEKCALHAENGHSWKSGKTADDHAALAAAMRTTAIRAGASPSDAVLAMAIILADMCETNTTLPPKDAAKHALKVFEDLLMGGLK